MSRENHSSFGPRRPHLSTRLKANTDEGVLREDDKLLLVTEAAMHLTWFVTTAIQ